jgi:NTP pyrophosphatase (non-canonical NTP hydrolase)
MSLSTRMGILKALSEERDRQERLKTEGRFANTLADPEMSHQDRFVTLGEEIGEVAAAVVQVTGLSYDRQETRDDLKKELIHAGACIVAWLEALE